MQFEAVASNTGSVKGDCRPFFYFLYSAFAVFFFFFAKHKNFNSARLADPAATFGQGKKYARGSFLGKGGFAKVYALQDLVTKEWLAGKVIPKKNLTKTRAQQKLHSEIKIHR